MNPILIYRGSAAYVQKIIRKKHRSSDFGQIERNTGIFH